METRPYFIFGDLLSCGIIGALCGLLCMFIVGQDWNMMVAMVAGMVIGMVLAVLIDLIFFFWLFGAMEVMMPTMLTGMLSGMAVGAIAAMGPLEAGWCAGVGALIGLGTLICTYTANAFLTGKVKYGS